MVGAPSSGVWGRRRDPRNRRYRTDPSESSGFGQNGAWPFSTTVVTTSCRPPPARRSSRSAAWVPTSRSPSPVRRDACSTSPARCPAPGGRSGTPTTRPAEPRRLNRPTDADRLTATSGSAGHQGEREWHPDPAFGPGRTRRRGGLHQPGEPSEARPVVLRRADRCAGRGRGGHRSPRRVRGSTRRWCRRAAHRSPSVGVGAGLEST